jgi:hypothetical protein
MGVDYYACEYCEGVYHDGGECWTCDWCRATIRCYNCYESGELYFELKNKQKVLLCNGCLPHSQKKVYVDNENYDREVEAVNEHFCENDDDDDDDDNEDDEKDEDGGDKDDDEKDVKDDAVKGKGDKEETQPQEKKEEGPPQKKIKLED